MKLSLSLSLAIAFSFAAAAQDDHAAMHDMGGMAHHHHHHMAGNPAGEFLMEQASGTSMNPKSWQMPMIGAKTGAWNWMFMGTAFLVDTQQSGPRGGDKFYGPNWGMIGTEHSVGEGSVMFTLMASLDPATVTGRYYPLLFQTGETAFGKPITDGQHPHDLIMGLGVQYAHPLGEGTLFQLYFAPVGDPALGPVAFPHRASASSCRRRRSRITGRTRPISPTKWSRPAMSHGIFRLEASGFHGREPNENRWNIDYGAIDSWSARFSVFPTQNWMAQVSVGRLHSPEALEQGDEIRSTASLHYSRPMGNSSWSTSLIWGRNHKTAAHRNTDSYTLESVVPVGRRNFITGRAELVDKDELFDAQPEIEEMLDRTAGSTFPIGAYTLGYTRDVELFPLSCKRASARNFTAYTLARRNPALLRIASVRCEFLCTVPAPKQELIRLLLLPVCFVRRVPIRLRSRLDDRRGERAADDGSGFRQTAHGARSDRLDQHIPDRRGFDWPGDHGAAGGIRDELIQHLVLRAAAHNVNHREPPVRARTRASPSTSR